VELAFKRLPVSEAVTPNHNPVLEGVRVDGVLLPDGAEVVLDADQTYRIEPVLAADAIETYRYLGSDGAEELRTEEPYVTFYAESGTFSQTSALWPDLERRYTTPSSDAPGTGRVWSVVRDRRGGMAWHTLTVTWR
jgi:hypothetical protein